MVWFEWDSAKNSSNRKKHGIDFETARFVFDDPNAVYEQDREERGERRWQTVGTVDGTLLILVAHTVAEAGDAETIRIISARRANRKERNRYDKAFQENRG